MAYTHYWTKNEKIDSTTWSKIKSKVQKIIESVEIGLDDVQITDDIVRFNGIGDDGYEDFVFARKDLCFNFCKTARKPYDLAVCMCLLAIKEECPDVAVKSDGCWGHYSNDAYHDGWQLALEKYKKLFGGHPPSWSHKSPLKQSVTRSYECKNNA